MDKQERRYDSASVACRSSQLIAIHMQVEMQKKYQKLKG
jgi:hypothetical protein